MKRQSAIIASIVVSVLCGAGLFVYVSGADQRAASDESLERVLVAVSDIIVGTEFDEALAAGLIEVELLPERLVPPTAVAAPEALSGQISVAAVAEGLPIVASHFATRDEIGSAALGPNTFARQIPEGRVAISFDAGNQVAGFIRPGDHVNLLIQVPDPAELGLDAGIAAKGTPTIGADGLATRADTTAVVHLFQDLEIVAVGQTPAVPIGAAPGTEVDPDAVPEGGTGATYTVMVAPKDAARLIYLTGRFPVHLALLPPVYEASEIDAVDASNALPDGLTADSSADGGR